MLAVALELAALLVLSALSDIRTYKVKNTVTIPFAMLGIATNTAQNGIPGLIQSILGMFAPVLLLFALYALKMLGAGDIKLLAAAGAVLGVRHSLSCTLCSFLFGGLIALILTLVRKNALERFKYFFSYIKCCFLSRSLLEYDCCGISPGSGAFRFTYAIIPGAVFQLALMYANRGQ